jgi:hypothetical protein
MEDELQGALCFEILKKYFDVHKYFEKSLGVLNVVYYKHAEYYAFKATQNLQKCGSDTRVEHFACFQKSGCVRFNHLL